MRPTVLLGTLALAGGLIGTALWLDRSIDKPAAAELLSAPSPVAANRPLAALVSPPPRIEPAPISPEPKTWPPIFADLAKSEPETYRAALQRAREMDDASIIPRLREIAGQTADPVEKDDILDTIHFLELPSLADTAADAKAARLASGQPELSRSPTNRWTGKPFPTP